MKKQKIESIYPLSPMQQGLLFHSQYEAGTGTYYEQTSCRIEGDLKVEAFKRAWQAVVDRHAILRTSFVWEGVKEPVQVVQQGLKLVFREEDWRGATPLEQSRKLEELLREEREQGFDLTKAPLMKLGLARVAEDAYYFIWANHHILFDGWCRELIVGEVFKMYEGYSRGREVEVERVRPYRDYIAWLGAQNLKEAEEFWREELRGIEGPTELGIERSGGAREEGEYEEKNVRLSEEASRRLEEEARKWQVTLNTMVEGAWAVVMSRYSGQGDVVFGATVSGRGGGLKGIEGMMGLFINTLPVRVEVRGEERVKDLMKRVQGKQSKVLEYEYSPLVEVQRWSEAPRGVPLFRAAFMFQNYPVDAGIRERAISGLHIGKAQRFSNNNYEMVIRAIPGKELLLNTIYDGERFEASNMERLLNHLKRVLEGMAENEQSRVIELPMMSEQEREEVIVEWNQTAAEYPRDRCVHELCEQQVDLTPHAVAVVYEGEHLTYDELNRRANQLARWLRKMGVGAEVKVGLCVERSQEMIIGLLGVMKAGGAYLPLDARYPQERLAYMIEDSGCPVIVTTEHLLEQLPVTWAQIVMIDDDWPAIARESDRNPELTTVSANLAYMIYTSGSTGKPKAVGLTHQSLCNLTVAQNRNLQVAAGASVLQFASFSFDAATWDWLMTLTCGAKLILISEADAQLPEKVLELIVKHEVETATLPPSLLMNVAKKPIPTVKTLIVAGEACPNELVRQWSGECRFINAYGPTESTVCATMTGAMAYGEQVGIGRANENTQIYILGRHQQPMPVGVTGEIYIAGVGLGRGYLNRSDLTAEKFKANPFASGERMYRSGDLGRYHKDGSIEYLGRIDDQVKIRGYRIELGEIEAVLNEHPSVTQGIVIAREDEPGEKRLVGYVVGPRQVSGEEFRKYLQERLPDYMVPGAIVQLEELPLTVNGKIDRRALPKPGLNGAGRVYVGPQTAVEEIVCGIWSEVLRVEKVGIHDNFFELGGHSLLATQVVSRMRNLLGVEVSLRSLFTHPTAAAIAAEVEQQQRAGGEAPVEAIGRAARDRELPLSYAQQRLWFIDQMEPGSAAYNLPCAVRLSGDLDADALNRSLNEIVRRHEVLRTSFPSRDGEPRQEIHAYGEYGGEHSELEPEIIDLMKRDEGEREEKLQEILGEEARLGFELSSGPLIRAKVIRLAADEHVLMVNMHHIVSDGWSMEIMVRELAEVYEAFTQGLESTLPELKIQYADYAVWQREWLQGEVLESRLQYWREQLKGVAVLDLPTDRGRPALGSYRGASERFQLSEELTGKLKQLSQREGVTLFMSVLAGFQALLARYSGQEDIAVGTPIAGRNRGEIEGLMGFFVNTLVMRVDLGEDPTARELLGRVREMALGAYAHQDVPFEKLVEELQPDRSLSRTPVFQVMIAMQNVPREALAISGLTLKGEALEAESAKFELTLTLMEAGENIAGILEYSKDIYDRETIRRMSRHYEILVKEIVRDAEQRIRGIELLSGSEREQILMTWNETAVEYPRDRCIHELFEEQVMRTPDVVAVVFNNQALTYRELNTQANRLAQALVERGGSPEVLVAVLVERGLDFLIAVLGIFKAGGAYLPLDPHHPAKRITQALDLSGAALVLTSPQWGPLATEAIAGLTTKNQPTLFFLEEMFEDLHQKEILESHLGPGQLAYVIFTSGSTGVPKGAMIEQRGMLNQLYAKVRDLRLDERDVVAQTASQCFDISVWQFLAVLLVGGQVQIFDEESAHAPARLLDRMEQRRVTILETVPSMMGMMLTEADGRVIRPDLSMLRWLIPTGEALPPELCRQWFRLYPQIPLLNAYGPTECSDDVTHGPIKNVLAESAARSSIGRPIANTQIYVLNMELEPQPIGVVGELYAGGEGVGRGYINEPGKTAESFVPDSFGIDEGVRFYRSGDLARYLADGNLEYMGRVDHQVKIHGFRIELGEIATSLSEHGSVEQAVVVAREDQPGEKRLVAYVVKAGSPEVSEQEHSSSQKTVTDWQTVFEEVYGNQELPTEETLINPRVWINSYTDQSFPEEEIVSCVEDTVSRILALKPRRVLEIGCGTGLILSRVAPECEVYFGTDFSGEALGQLSRQLGRLGLEEKVKLIEQAGDDLKGMPAEYFDVVVINEVVQYFPNIEYLLRILEQLPGLVASDSSIFLGDLRNLDLWKAFRASVEVSRAAGSMKVEELRSRIAKKMRQEKELLIAPGFFGELKKEWLWIEEVGLELKGTDHANELVKYRYDAILHVRRSWSDEKERRSLDWDSDGLRLESLRQTLRQRNESIEIQGIPNSRVQRDAMILRLLEEAPAGQKVEELREKLEDKDDAGTVDPRQLWELGRELGYRVNLSWPSSGGLGAYRAIFQREVATRKIESEKKERTELNLSRNWSRWKRYANQPLQEAVGKEQVRQWREYLAERLPQYMVPAVFVELERLPLTPNGKLDRRALPAPEIGSSELEREYAAPRTLAEQRLAEIWSQVLGVDRVGIHDDFFELGGHSLLATQVISRVRAVLDVELPLRALFESPRLSELAVSIEQARMAARGLQAPPFVRASREGELPLSYAQQRLWFIDQLEPGSAAYNIPCAVRLSGRLDTEALNKSLNEIIARHEVLRTSFPSSDGEPRQEIHEFSELRPDFIDLMESDEAEQQQNLEAVLGEEARRGFDLSTGPLIRAKLLRLAEEEHVLVVTMHHIVSDGWSLTIIVKEFSQLYEAFTQGRESPLPELKIQYADFAVWQRQWLKGEVLAVELGYWREQLSGLEPLELPLDYPRPALAGDRGASLNFELSEELAEGLVALSRREGVTLFMTVLAAFQTLLMRYSGQEDVAVGSPIANRTRAETEGLIGFFVNTLVLRTRVEGESSFQKLLARVREVCLDAYSYQDLPFEQIVEHLQPERNLSRQPLFQVMFALQNAPAAALELPGLGLSVFEIPVETSKFDLFFSAVEAKGHWICSCNYNSDLFEPATIGRMSEHLRALLKSLVANPLTPLSEHKLLSPDEHQQILFEWNQTGASLSPNCCIHQLLESQVARTPDAVAVSSQARQLSYRELNVRANRVAHRLRVLGIGPEKVVGICSERSVEMLVWVLGILKAGGAYLPLDPAYPQERLAFMVKDSGVEVLVTQELLANKFPEYQGTVIFLDEDCGQRWEESEVNPGVEMDWDCPAYVIYTSGSTGKPKGVTMIHRALTNLIQWQLDHPSHTPPLRTLQFSSLSFDVSFQEIFATWCAGARLVLIDEETHRDPVRLWEALGAGEVERLFLPFVALQQLAEAAENGGAAGAGLRRIVTAGEALKMTPQIETMLSRLTHCILENQYGPTESHVVSSYGVPPPAAQRVKKLPPIGRPIANTEIYILDNWMNPVPVGVIGDLYLGGECLARGYFSQPTPTAEKFIPAPFNEDFGARLYQTGDRARYLPDGDVEFMGRRDDQVKVRGYRIELGEVEAVLAEAPSIRECAVAVRKDDSGNGRLVGYVVSHEGEAIAVGELRHFLQQRLPEYMVPSNFVQLEALPVTASGKADRRALAVLEKNAVNEGTRVAPQTAIEELVAGIFEEVLKLDRVGISDNFFEIGGHSLLATQVVSRVRNAFGVEIGVRSIFESPTVEGLVRRIEAAMMAGDKDEAPPLMRVSREESLPLSFAQQRLWFMDQLEPASAAYNLPCAVRLRGRLDVDALRKSLNEIVTRHEVLRTGFPSRSGEPRQEIQKIGDLQPELIDLMQSDEAGQQKTLQVVLQDEAKRGFDLSCAPLIRTKVIRLAEDDHVLIVNMHHIVSDGWSIGVIVREFGQLYEAFSQGLESPLTKLDIQYADYAMWQREWLQGEVLERQLQYWRRQLDGLGILELPTDRARPAATSYRGASERIKLSDDLTQKLRNLSRREGVTLFMSLLAGFQLLLARYSGQEDIAIGTPIAGRNRKETEGLIGLFLNTLVMRVNVGGNPSVPALLARVREAALGAYAHQDLPFEKLVEEIHPERTLSHQPLFQVWFVLQNIPAERVDLPGLSVESLPVEDSFTKFDLMLSFSEGEKELTGTLRYSTDLFDRRRIKRMLSHYEFILEGMAADEESNSREHDIEREQYQHTAMA